MHELSVRTDTVKKKLTMIKAKGGGNRESDGAFTSNTNHQICKVVFNMIGR